MLCQLKIDIKNDKNVTKIQQYEQIYLNLKHGIAYFIT